MSMTPQQRAAVAKAMAVIARYRAETPLGHQPYMIAGAADAALQELYRALALDQEKPTNVATGCECANCANGMGICHSLEEQAEQEPVDAKLDGVLRQAIARSGKVIHPPQLQPLTDEQIDKEFEAYAAKFDTLGDEWQDMGAGDYFKAGFKAAHGIKVST